MPGLGLSNTRAAHRVLTPPEVNRRDHPVSSAPASPSPARQICPPRLGLSSTTPTPAPCSDEHAAAAKPAGPPPTTSTSNCIPTLLIGAHLHSGRGKSLTTTPVRHAVDPRATLKTNSHRA